MELRSGKTLVKGDKRENSDNDPEDDVYSLLSDYDEKVVAPRKRMETTTSLPFHPFLSLQWTSPESAICRRQ